MVQQIVCLVIDEAHRASGNYAYCMVIREVCFTVMYYTHLFYLHLKSCFVVIIFFIVISFDSL
jgi:hypothetical protein